MTREKAINVLKNEIRCVKSTSCLREECLNCTLTLPEHDILTALNMAIEALDSPTLMPGISNLISRQAVKEATNKVISACEDCPHNIASLASAPSGAQEDLLTKIKAEVGAMEEQIRKIEEMVQEVKGWRD